MLQTAVVLTGFVLLGQPEAEGPCLVGKTVEPTAAAEYAFGDQTSHSTEAFQRHGASAAWRLPRGRSGVLQAMLEQQEEEASGSGAPFGMLTPEPPGAGSQPAQAEPPSQMGDEPSSGAADSQAQESLFPIPPEQPAENSEMPDALPGSSIPGPDSLPGAAQVGDLPPSTPGASAADVAPPGMPPYDPAYEAAGPPPAGESPFVLEEPATEAATCEPAGCGACAGSGGACGRGAGCGGGIRAWLHSIMYDAWLQQGFTINTLSPRNRSNFPVTFNDGSNEYQLNQLYLVLDRPVTAGACWDLGGRVDFMYGTDWMYTGAKGLELHDDGSPRWSSEQYGPAMPQLYAQVHTPWLGGMDFKLGRFYTLLGYESVPAVDNFFYSHSYHLQYGEPFTHTGLLGSLPLGRLTLHAGMTRGWDAWEDNNNDLAFLGGAEWLSADQRWKLAFAIHTGPEQDEPPQALGTRTTYSLVLSCRVTDRLLYVIQHDLGVDEKARLAGTRDANWYGINQYLIYQLNPEWASGLRFEWFRDEDGFRVNPGVPASYYELSFGLKYQPWQRLICRSELRWDWANGDAPGYRPFGDGTRQHQVLVDFDVILRF